jgi:hypothetical protein
MDFRRLLFDFYSIYNNTSAKEKLVGNSDFLKCKIVSRQIVSGKTVAKPCQFVNDILKYRAVLF